MVISIISSSVKKPAVIRGPKPANDQAPVAAFAVTAGTEDPRVLSWNAWVQSKERQA